MPVKKKWLRKIFNKKKQGTTTVQMYADGDDKRTWQILADLDIREAVKKHPDFDIAYLRAAYPSNKAEDHQNANVNLLKQGLEKSIIKSRVLARLSNYYVSQHNSNMAIDFAIQSLLALKKRPNESYVQPIILLQKFFIEHGFGEEAKRLETIRPQYTLGSQAQKDISAVINILSHYRHEAEEARRHLTPFWEMLASISGEISENINKPSLTHPTKNRQTVEQNNVPAIQKIQATIIGENEMSYEDTITQYLQQLGVPTTPFTNAQGAIGLRFTTATYMGLQVAIQILNDQILMFQFGIGYPPPINSEPLLRQLLMLNSSMIGVYFGILNDNAIMLRSSRMLEGIDFIEFKQSIDTICNAFMQNGIPVARTFQLSSQPV